MSTKQPLARRSSNAEIDAFVRRSRQLAPGANVGRLLFALEATASREATWDRACRLQGEMFIEAAGRGGLSVQLVWYRGFAEFKALPWARRADALLRLMQDVRCAGGTTQIARVLSYAIAATRKRRVNALVFVGDCVEESPQELYALAGQLGLLGLPVLCFHEGGDVRAEQALREIAARSGGAYCRFDTASAEQLRELLRAAAAYASGGRAALADLSKRGGEVKRLAHQLSGSR